MCLVEDLHSGLIYNAAFRPELMNYDNNYQNEQGLSPLFRSHLDAVADIIARCVGTKSLVEIGCGKGTFLEILLARGFDITGFDPAYEGKNPNVVRAPFKAGIDIQAKALVMRHVLEHVQNPFDFLASLRDANNGGGLIYIEVPCFDWICERRVWFDIFYEHVNYFRISDFQCIFGRVIETGKLFGDQYLYAVADLATLKSPRISPGDRAAFPEDFTRGLDGPQPAGKSAIWGGASKGVIFGLLKSRRGHVVDAVIDINPAKQGKYLPATGFLVQSPAKAMQSLPSGSNIYVMNSNYLQEIKAMSQGAYNYIAVDGG